MYTVYLNYSLLCHKLFYDVYKQILYYVERAICTEYIFTYFIYVHIGGAEDYDTWIRMEFD
jgi:hypothetical protein